MPGAEGAGVLLEVAGWLEVGALPSLTSAGGCSLYLPFGAIHDTAGNVPFFAAS